MRIAIHQPNFFPYYGFFQKMKECDSFVIMGNCQFEKNGYQNRFNIDDKWFTMSVRDKKENIIDKKYINHVRDWLKIKKSFPKKDLFRFDMCISDSVLATNTNIIYAIKNYLGIKTRITFDYPTELSGTKRLVDICVTNGATEYLSGISGKKYLDESKFYEAGIKVIYQDESKIIKKPIIDFL